MFVGRGQGQEFLNFASSYSPPLVYPVTFMFKSVEIKRRDSPVSEIACKARALRPGMSLQVLPCNRITRLDIRTEEVRESFL
jgi:hypothetical protein